MNIGKVEQQILRAITKALQTDINDSDIGFVTITAVRTSKDLDLAKVFVNFLGNEQREIAGLKALNRAKSRIRSFVARELNLRRTPDFNFVIDKSLENGNNIEKILKNLKDKGKN